ncbi:MAG: hypothetical protein P8125_07490 [Gemmatimonadota bacterium]|jgi:hypothetical protein
MCYPLASRPALIALIVHLAAGCAAETESAARWDGSIRDSAGIEIVENFGAPLWKPGEEWRLVEDLTIGMRDGPPEYQFGRIGGFEQLSDGRIVVADRMASQLRFFSPAGEHLLSIGKQGQGPKEFGEGMLGILRGNGDTLLVTDYRNQQVHRIAPDGSWQASFSTRPDGGWWNSGWDVTPAGTIVSMFSPVQRPDQPPADTLDVVVVRNLDGTLGDTLGVVPTSQSFRFADGEPEQRFYAGRPDIDLRWDEQGLITGRSDTYKLTWLNLDGEPERIVHLYREPNPFTPEEQATLMARFDEMIDGSRLSPERKQQVRRSIKFEDNYPYYRRFMNGPQGTLWLRRVLPIRDMTPEQVEALTNSISVRPAPGFDIFDAQGRYLGIVVVPEEMPLGLLHGDRMFGIVRDELDVEYLKIYRIEGMDGVDDEESRSGS